MSATVAGRVQVVAGASVVQVRVTVPVKPPTGATARSEGGELAGLVVAGGGVEGEGVVAAVALEVDGFGVGRGEGAGAVVFRGGREGDLEGAGAGGGDGGGAGAGRGGEIAGDNEGLDGDGEGGDVGGDEGQGGGAADGMGAELEVGGVEGELRKADALEHGGLGAEQAGGGDDEGALDIAQGGGAEDDGDVAEAVALDEAAVGGGDLKVGAGNGGGGGGGEGGGVGPGEDLRGAADADGFRAEVVEEGLEGGDGVGVELKEGVLEGFFFGGEEAGGALGRKGWGGLAVGWLRHGADFVVVEGGAAAGVDAEG